MSSSNAQEVYLGYNELVSYLKQRKSKSLWGFLLRHREIIVTGSMVLPADLDSIWTRRFLTEAEKLELNQTAFDALSKKVSKERSRGEKEFEKYWCGVIEECKKRHSLSGYEAERERIFSALSKVEEKIRAVKADLAGSSSRWFDEDVPDTGSDSRQDSDGGFGGFGSPEIPDPVDEDNGGSDGDPEPSRRKINRKRKRGAPPRRETNPRNQERVNYNVGSSPKRRRKNKPAPRLPSSSTPPPQSPVSSEPEMPLPPSSPIILEPISPSPISPDKVCNRECPLHCI